MAIDLSWTRGGYAYPQEIRRYRMSYEDYQALPEKPKHEWVDGEVLVMAPPSREHGETQVSVAFALKAALTGIRVAVEVDIALPRNRERRPDVIAVTQSSPDDDWLAHPPLLVAEVLSRGTRSEDMLRKSIEYAEAGIARYWLADPDNRVIDALLLVDGRWETEAHLDDQQPVGAIDFGEHGTVTLDVNEIFPA